MKRGKWFATWGVLIVLGISVLGVGFIGYSQNEIQLAPGQSLKNFNCEGSQNKQCNLDIKDKISGFSITGELTLNSDKSIIRAILVDKSGKEYLIYEAYPLVSGNGKIRFADACEETCVLPGISPLYIKIQVNGANMRINKIRYDSSAAPRDVSTRATDVKRSKDNEKIKKINAAIRSKGMKWTAGETSVSKMTYAQKKRLFTYPNGTQLSELPDLQGFEYYKGGVFELSNSRASSRSVPETTSNPSLPSSWDWRNVHGENWMTPVKDQGQAGNCGYFTLAGTLESQINLYYNRHINPDLSEQMLADCRNTGLIKELTLRQEECCPNTFFCWGSHNFNPLDKRFVDESCDPYAQREPSYEGSLNANACNYDYVCSDWQNRFWKISDFHDYLIGERKNSKCTKETELGEVDDLKKAIINNGPLVSGIDFWNHAMVLIGYDGVSDWKTIENCGDKICISSKGCTDWSCSKEGENIKTCRADSSGWRVETLNCSKNSWGGVSWKSCKSDEVCYENKCVKGKFPVGGNACSLKDREDMFVQYSPSLGDTRWVFKNSWGENWGENGYLTIATNIENLGRIVSFPIGPFIPPAGQSYKISCVDKDKDGYCNWGISEQKPDSCPSSCGAEKDSDDSNPKKGSFNKSVVSFCGNGVLEKGETCESGVTALKSCAAGDSIQESCTNCQISATTCSAPSAICQKPEYYAIVRCYNANTQDHMTVIGDISTCSIFPGYTSERVLGYVPKSEPGAVSPISRKGSSQKSSSGMVSFYRCTVNGNSDSFSSLTSNCEGQRKDMAEYISVFNSKDVYSWSTPKLITRCVIPSTGEHFDSEVLDANGNPTCEAPGYTPEGTRWYVWATPPAC